MAKTAGHCYRVGAEVTCRQCSDERSEVWPAHREVAREDFSEALVKLCLNESNEGGLHVLLGSRLSA